MSENSEKKFPNPKVTSYNSLTSSPEPKITICNDAKQRKVTKYYIWEAETRERLWFPMVLQVLQDLKEIRPNRLTFCGRTCFSILFVIWTPQIYLVITYWDPDPRF